MMKFIASCFAIAVFIDCAGQTKSDQQGKEDYELLFAAPHFSATLIPYLTQKATIITEAGNYAPSSTMVMGTEGGVNYHLHMNTNYSLIIGLHAGVGGRNHHIFIAKEAFTPNLERDVDENGRFTRTADLYFSMPLMVERRWHRQNGNHWNLNAGVNVRHVTENFYIYSSHRADVSGRMINVEHLDLMVGNNRKPWLNYNIGGGYAWLLGNKNFLRLNLLANYSSTNMVSGSYTITVTGKEPTVGKYTANLSFFGLSFIYILTGVNKVNKRLKNSR